VGSSYLPSEILAAFLHAQLTAADEIQAARRNLWNGYWRALGEWASRNGIGMPHVPSDRVQPFHLFYLLLPSLERRQAFIAHMKERGIMTPFHYVPLHTSEMGHRLGGASGDCPVTESVSDRLVRLPLYPSLSAADQARVIDGVMEFRP
jgi:dTDP-4-amino-4,6-dideoxygalactose transaminase